MTDILNGALEAKTLIEKLRLYMQLRFSTPSKITGATYQMVPPEILSVAIMAVELLSALTPAAPQAVGEVVLTEDMVDAALDAHVIETCPVSEYITFCDRDAQEMNVLKDGEHFAALDIIRIDQMRDTERFIMRAALTAALAQPQPAAVPDGVTELAQAKAEAIELLLTAKDIWTDYGSGFRVHFSFDAGASDRVVERIFTAKALAAPLPKAGE